MIQKMIFVELIDYLCQKKYDFLAAESGSRDEKGYQAERSEWEEPNVNHGNLSQAIKYLSH